MKTSKFFLSTFIAAAAMTSTAWAEGTTEIASNTLISTDTVYSETYTGDNIVIKVTNDAVFTISGALTINGSDPYGLRAGGDNWNVDGLGNGSSANGGTIEVSGTVDVTQTNADADGVISVTGVLNSAIVVLENGGLDDAKSGSMTISEGGTVNAAQFNVLKADAALTITGEGSSLILNNTSGSGTKVSFNNSGKTTISDGAMLSYGDLNDTSGKSDITNSGTIIIDNATFVSNVKVVNTGTFSISGTSTLKIGTLTGKKLQVVADTTLADSTIGGNISVGYDAENASDTTLDLAGTNTFGILYVGNEGRTNKYALVVSGSDSTANLGQLYSRTGSSTTIADGATLNISDYWQSKGEVVIDASTVNHSGANFYVYNNDSADVATIKLTNGATLNHTNAYSLTLGGTGEEVASVAKGNASVILEGKSTLNVNRLFLNATGTVEEVEDVEASTSLSATDSTVVARGEVGIGTGAALILENSTFTAAQTLTNNGSISVSDSTFSADSIANSGMILVNGNSTITADSVSGAGIIRAGYVWDSDARKYTVNSEKSTITFDADTISVGEFRVANAKLNFNGSATITTTSMFTRLENTELALGAENKLTINGMLVLGGSTGGVTLSSGAVEVSAKAGASGWNTICFQSAPSVIGKDAIFTTTTASAIDVYDTLTVNGKFHDNRDVIGWHTIDIGTFTVDSEGRYASENGAHLVISGEGAEFVSTHNTMEICEAKEVEFNGEIYKFATSSVTVTNKAKLELAGMENRGNVFVTAGGQLIVNGVLTNMGTLTVDASSTLTVTGNIKNTGTLIIEGCEALPGPVTLAENASVSIGAENASVTLTAAGNGISVSEAESLDSDEVVVPEGVEFVAAWSFVVTGIDEGESVEVTMDVGLGLDTTTIQVWHKADSGAVWDDTTVTEWDYDETTGKLTFSTNSFSSYAVTGTAVPEPSAFGLLAGLGALALVAARRRRK